jgi:HK97 family phage prohead protease
MEYKELEYEVKEVNDSGVFEGLAAGIGNLDLGNDKILKGAFLETIRKGVNWPILSSHRIKEHLGYNLEAKEVSEGLYVKGQLNLEVQTAREKHALAKQAKEVGAKMGLSIGYNAMDFEYVDNATIRELKVVDVMEYSITAIPMNPKANVINVKRADGGTIEIDDPSLIDNVRDFEVFLRDVGISSYRAKVAASVIFQRDVEGAELIKAIKDLTKRMSIK